MAVARGRGRQSERCDRSPAAQVDDCRRRASSRLHVGAVPAGVHADRATDRAGDADRPLEAGEPVADRRAGDDRELGGARRRSRSVSSTTRDAGVVAGHDGRRAPGKPPVGDEEVADPRPMRDDRDAGARDRRSEAAERIVVVDHDHGGGPAADPVRRVFAPRGRRRRATLIAELGASAVRRRRRRFRSRGPPSGEAADDLVRAGR